MVITNAHAPHIFAATYMSALERPGRDVKMFIVQQLIIIIVVFPKSLPSRIRFIQISHPGPCVCKYDTNIGAHMEGPGVFHLYRN